MGGLGVISTGFLAAGALLAAVPVVIHLLFRRKAPRVDLGSLRFLRIAIRDNAHRRKIRRWMLLALRVAGMLLLGFLFARPYLAAPELPGLEREVAILIDRSASMGAGPLDRSAFARARDRAAKLLLGLPEGTAVHLAFFDEGGIASVPSGKLGEAQTRPGFAGTDFAKGLAWARDRVIQSRRKLRQVHLFTDLQRAGLDHPPLDGFPEGIEVDVVDVGRPLKNNVAVDDARVIRAEIRPDSPPLIAAFVFNAGSFPVRDVEVKLTLEGEGETFRLSEKVAIEGGTRREVRFSPTIRKPGLYRGSVEVMIDDELPFDNRRWLAFEAKVPETVLLVDGDPGATAFANETYYLEAALRLRVPGAGPSATPYEPRRLDWNGGSDWPDLRSTRVVVLANVDQVPDRVADSLKAFVEGGGRLVIFAGDHVDVGALASLGKRGLLPAEVDGTVDGPLRFGAWQPEHPLLGPFTDPQYGDLRAFTYLRLSRLKPSPGSQILASARPDVPILVEKKLGRGLVLQWASAADNDRGDWAVQRLYLPVIHQMMGYLTDRLPGSGLVRESLASPDAEPGIEAKGDGLVVRNADPTESRIDRATLAEVRSTLRLPELKVPPKPETSETLEQPEGTSKPGEVWRWFAWTLLIVLVAETFVANRTYA